MKEVRPVIKNHYGILVDSSVPVTGVVHNLTPEWLFDEIAYGSIDMGWEAHISECENEEHDDCYCDVGSSTYLVGDWRKNSDGLWGPVEDGEKGFAAIVGEIYTQVVYSKWTQRCVLCSPCYPGQGDLGNPGEFLAYDLPPELYGHDALAE